ncbi:MAG: CRTAC1 family protein [Fidelibacterota bacterium]|nr:MAG: CRTAC1 family protein [Candidatus Neomarinimicrobiota bacterium]
MVSKEDIKKIAFTDITHEAGIGVFAHENAFEGDMYFPEPFGSGCAFIDYNNDGWQDVLAVGGGFIEEPVEKYMPGLWLFGNNGDGTFTLRTDEAGLNYVTACGFGLAVADYDNDGDEDFVFTTLRRNMLFRNDGGVFKEIGYQAGFGTIEEWSTGAVFVDGDRNGWLDLYICNYVNWSIEIEPWNSLDGENKVYSMSYLLDGIPNRYYRNNGDGTFNEQTEQAGLGLESGRSLGAVGRDVNRDGWLDIIVANDEERNFLYTSNKDGTFSELGRLAGLAYDSGGEATSSRSIAGGMIDNSANVAIFFGNISGEMMSVFQNTQTGWFTDRKMVSGIGPASKDPMTFGLALIDIEQDGDLDLIAANGHIDTIRTALMDGITYHQKPQLFLNDGRGIFAEVGDDIGGVYGKPMVARGLAYADIDRDGDVDILILENGGSLHLWRNDSRGGNFLRVNLEGRESNRQGIGARIVAKVDATHLERTITSGGSYLSDSEKTVTFGLGRANTVDSLLVYWPNGQIDHYSMVEGNQTVRLVEGSASQ